jgi:signal transduction histidine kinase/DNA-binding response OmpR family regulator
MQAAENNTPYQRELVDIRLRYDWAALGLPIAAAVLSLLGTADTIEVRALSLLMVVLGVGAWLLGQWHDGVGRWALAVSLVALTFAAAALHSPLVLLLLAVVPVITVFVIGQYAGIRVTAGSAALLWLSQHLTIWRLPPDGYLMVALGMSATLVVSLVASRHMRTISGWAWGTYSEARSAFTAARQRQATAASIVDDLAHANRQLALANENLAAARRLAEQAQRTKSAFVSKVSHEFRTPLNMIIGLTELMIHSPETYSAPLPPDLARDLDIVRRNCEHLAGLVDDVLDLSQVEAGQLALHREDVDVAKLIHEAIAAVRPLLDKKLLACTTELDADLVVYCDATRIRQVILNLLSNAARFTSRGGIQITGRREESGVTVSIRDTGPGIAPNEVQRIFEPFYQAAIGGRRPQDGSGLGLAISQQFVEQHGGKLWLESELGVGSTFHFALPLQDPLPVAAPAHRWISESWPWVERHNRPDIMLADVTPRIVMVDQTGELARLVQRYAADTEYVLTHDVLEAAQELRRGESQGALMNCASPNQLWPLVSALGALVPDLPILGCAFAPSREYALAAGARGYLIKPLRREDLDLALDAVEGPLEQVLVVDDDCDARSLLRRMIELYDPAIQVVEAASGQETLRALADRRFDLVLLDILMEDMDGWQVLDALRAAEADRSTPEPSVPVVIVSGQDPRDRPLASPLVMVSTGNGLSLQRVIQYADRLTHLLFEPEDTRAPERPETARDELA